MTAVEGINSLRGIFEDPPELFLIKGGRWNQASTFFNIFLALISSTILVVQQSEPIVVCMNCVSNKTDSLRSNYAYAEEECEGQMLEDFPASLFHKYIGWVFTMQIILIVMWGRICIGGNRILIEKCKAFGQIMESFINVAGHMTDEERKILWINQDYLQRSSKMLFAEMRTKEDIKKYRSAKQYGNIWLSSLFSIFNICILHFTTINHKDIVECELTSDVNLTCQFTAYDYISILAVIFSGIFLLELLALITETWIFSHKTFEYLKSVYDTEDKQIVGKSRDNKNMSQIISNQDNIPYEESCDLFHLVDALIEIHGKAMTFLFLSIIDQKVKLRWEYMGDGETTTSLYIKRKDSTFYEIVKETLGHFNLAPQIFYKAIEVNDVKKENDWKMVQESGSPLDGIDWDTDPVEIPLTRYLPNLNQGENSPSIKLTVLVVWNTRQIWNAVFMYEGKNSENGKKEEREREKKRGKSDKVLPKSLEGEEEEHFFRKISSQIPGI